MSSGISDREWRGIWVDSEMKDSWLERLNDIPTIQIQGTCAGHKEHDLPLDWMDRLTKVQRIYVPENGPSIFFFTSFERPLERISNIFGDQMLYRERGCFNLNSLRKSEEVYITKMAYVEHCPPEKIFHIIPWVPEAISIQAVMYRSEMTVEQFDRWWEIVISGLERLS